MEPLILAADPGLKGALAWLRGDELLAVEDMPVIDNAVNPTVIKMILEDKQITYGTPKVVVVERQQAFPKQGATSGFKTGVGYGMLLGLVAGMGWPLEIRSSSEWKPRLKLNRDKERSRKAAIDRWPIQVALFSRKRDEGRAEAALLGMSLYMERYQGQRQLESRLAPSRRVVRRRG